MTATTLDPKSALVVVDLQKSPPVVLVNVAGGAPGRTEQGFDTTALPPDSTDLASELNRRRQDYAQVVIAGVATSIGVESTARQAFDLGFNVTLAIDAMTDMSAEAHANSVARIFPRLGETGSTAEIIPLLGNPSA